MNKIFSIGLLSVLLYLTSCQNLGANAQTGSIINATIPVDSFEKILSTIVQVQLIDVRTPEEYAQGHLKNAVNVDINSDDFESRIQKLDKTKPVLVYCLSGGRSGRAASKMEDMGFSTVYNMQGGIMQWRSAGKATESGVGAPAKTSMSMDAFGKLTSANKYVLVDFNATWCEPCKKMMPVLESLADKKKDKLSFVKIDADDNKELLIQKGIESIPYLELYKDGTLVWKHNGYIDEDALLKETNL